MIVTRPSKPTLPEHPPRGHGPISYGEIPKSCTMENRQNAIEHQLYATIQRQKPPVPPFSNSKGFFDMKRTNLETDTTVDICPYATSADRQFRATGARCNTLGRFKNLEMTEYQKQKLLDEANTVRIRVSVIVNQSYQTLMMMTMIPSRSQRSTPCLWAGTINFAENPFLRAKTTTLTPAPVWWTHLPTVALSIRTWPEVAWTTEPRLPWEGSIRDSDSNSISEDAHFQYLRHLFDCFYTYSTSMMNNAYNNCVIMLSSSLTPILEREKLRTKKNSVDCYPKILPSPCFGSGQAVILYLSPAFKTNNMKYTNENRKWWW